jgi:p-aminobenzoyl-glutamate transporter AbgT
VERPGNRLWDRVSRVAPGTLLLILLPQLAVWLGRQLKCNVQRDGQSQASNLQTIRAMSLVDSDGLWWWLSCPVRNFLRLPPLGLVLVGLPGIRVAERIPGTLSLTRGGGECRLSARLRPLIPGTSAAGLGRVQSASYSAGGLLPAGTCRSR